jgi:hypothetical protein
MFILFIPLPAGVGNALFARIVKKTSARSVLKVGQKLELSKSKHYYTVKTG